MALAEGFGTTISRAQVRVKIHQAMSKMKLLPRPLSPVILKQALESSYEGEEKSHKVTHTVRSTV